ncbi:MAG: hypothetical protein A2020_11100 [Lentisphaerae bacterium GWF2_45_14]|nr:MAG: hypothetical protein A2020_11100 [Lentisphaerae bacterium GWF2_45_14]
MLRFFRKNKNTTSTLALSLFLFFAQSLALNSGNAVIENCEISGNSSDGQGGGLYLKTEKAELINSTVYGNTSSESGGGIAFEQGKNPKISNSVFWNNTAPASKEIVNPTSYLFRNDIQQSGFANSNGNISADPLFSGVNDLRLQSSSPAIGQISGTGLSPVFDKNGARRGSPADMGAYEYNTDNRTIYVNDSTGLDSYNGLAAVYDSLTGNGPKKTIQSGINAAVPGDTVAVSAGTYKGTGNKDLDFKGKSVKLYGAGAATTSIDCENSGRAIYFHSEESAEIKGFTLLNGTVSGSFPEGSGGAILAVNSSPTIRNCIIKDNTADWGGAIEIYHADMLLENCLVVNNTAQKTGGSLYITGLSFVDIVNSTIADNSEVSGEEQSAILNSLPEVNIFNSITEALHIIRYSPSNVTASYSCIKDGFTGTGNITWSTSTIVFESSGYKLNPFSPAIDSADPEKAPEQDLAGSNRYDSPLAENSFSSSAPDMGAYEFTSDQVSGTSATLSISTDESSAVSYTVTNVFTNTQAASGSVTSAANATHTLPIGIYKVAYSISGTDSYKTVHFDSNLTVNLCANESSFSLGTVSTYKRYAWTFEYIPFGLTDSGVAYENEVADIMRSGAILTKPDDSTRTISVRQFDNAPITRAETLGYTYTASGASDIICENLPVAALSLPDQTIVFKIYYDEVSSEIALPSGALDNETSGTGIDTFERFSINVNHLVPGSSETFYVKENDAIAFSSSPAQAAITAATGSGVSDWTKTLATFDDLVIASFNPSSVTATSENANASNNIAVTVNYQATSELAVPMSGLTEGYGGGDPAQAEDSSYTGSSLDSYKRYSLTVDYTLLGASVDDKIYVQENDVVTLSASPAQAVITRDSVTVGTETLTNFPPSDNMEFTHFSPSDTITAVDSNADSGNLIIVAAFVAESAVAVPLNGLTEGYGGSDPSKSSDESYTGTSLDTYERYQANVSYTGTSYTSQFYVGETDSISLARGTATVSGTGYPGQYTLFDMEGLVFTGFTPAGPITAEKNSASAANVVSIAAQYEIETSVAVPLSGLDSSYAAADPSATEAGYTGTSMDTYKRYMVTVDYTNIGSSLSDTFYTVEGDTVSLVQGTATVSSSVKDQNVTLKTFPDLDFVGFTPSGLTVTDALSDPANSIIISAWEGKSEVAIPLTGLTEGYGGGDPEEQGGGSLDTRKRYKAEITYKNHDLGRSESFYGMENDNATVTPSQAAISGVNSATVTLNPFSGWTINSYTLSGTTTESPSLAFSFSDSCSNASKVISIYANYTIENVESELLLPAATTSYEASNPAVPGSPKSLDTWKRFAYDIQLTPVANSLNKVVISWQRKVVMYAEHENVETFILRSKVPGTAIGTPVFPERISAGQELGGNTVVVYAGNIITDNYSSNSFTDTITPGTSGTYEYRVYTRLTDPTKTAAYLEDTDNRPTFEISENTDIDCDGLSLEQESLYGSDPYNSDSDNDGISDGDEVNIYGSNPIKADSDGDEICDYDEIFIYETDPVLSDTDCDGLNDGVEIYQTFTDPLNPDCDDDEILDGDEVSTYNSDPLDEDSDDDGIPDGVEVYLFQTNPNSTDSDGDGIDDFSEIYTYMSDPLSTDTDKDGLTDGFEVLSTNTDPCSQDSDNDGIADSDEDSDSDGVSNIEEKNSGMNPSLVATDVGGYLAEKTVLEDAEDQSAARWTVLNTETSSVANIVDPDNSANRVIELADSAMNGVMFTPALTVPGGQLKLEWKFKTSASYDIAVALTTSNGLRYIHYTSNTSNNLGTGESIEYGLGAASGSWTTIRRDLQADLWNAQSDNNIISVDSVTVKGSMYVDDISSMVYVDSDRDLIPDSIELAAGLNPYDASDASSDSDGDSISNLSEFMAGTPFAANADTDNDGIPDSTDPNPASSADTDSDGLPDDWENYYFGNLAQNASGDPDSDGVENLTEFLLGRNPNATAEDDTADSLQLRVFHP